MKFFSCIKNAISRLSSRAMSRDLIRDRHARLFASLAMTMLVASSWLFVVGTPVAQASWPNYKPPSTFQIILKLILASSVVFSIVGILFFIGLCIGFIFDEEKTRADWIKKWMKRDLIAIILMVIISSYMAGSFIFSGISFLILSTYVGLAICVPGIIWLLCSLGVLVIRFFSSDKSELESIKKLVKKIIILIVVGVCFYLIGHWGDAVYKL